MHLVFGTSRYEEEQYTDPPGDPGLFGPGSVTWRVHASPALLLGGVSAVMLQTLHPLTMAGVADHSNWREAPLERLSRTASFVTATTYASTEVAESIIAVVRAVHRRVVGTAPDGRPYDAGDPALLRWVHTAEVASFLRAYRRYELRPLPGWAQDRYMDEMAVVAGRLGAASVPRSRAEVRSYFRAVRPELEGGQPARDTVSALMAPFGSDPVVQAAYTLVVQAAVDLLPGWAKNMLGLRELGALERAALRPAAWALMNGLRAAAGPPPVLRLAEERCQGGARRAA